MWGILQLKVGNIANKKIKSECESNYELLIDFDLSPDEVKEEWELNKLF